MSRNRKPLTLGDKLRIIEQAEERKGATKASIARDLNIPESSLKTILAEKESILLNAAKFGLKRKAAKDGKCASMAKSLVEWLRQARNTIANSFRHCGFKGSDACSTSEAAVSVDDEPEFGCLQLPGTFSDYVSADNGVAVCSAVSLDNSIEAVCPESTDTSDEEEMDDTGEASTSIPTYAKVLSYIDNIRRFACARDDVGDLLPDIAALERKLMRCGWSNESLAQWRKLFLLASAIYTFGAMSFVLFGSAKVEEWGVAPTKKNSLMSFPHPESDSEEDPEDFHAVAAEMHLM
ncbi:hypothetical protein HPB50_003536 [Hyalomma asiaticum]|uniref:Uncharacterized protein n=1 Tax=Hyalomma asiaticum TaxID=266040 RepID=A0ACB7SMK0_HYAAI|nr:hypothetical protein HPB50_003536 [Hyalomma asiaticum]